MTTDETQSPAVGARPRANRAGAPGRAGRRLRAAPLGALLLLAAVAAGFHTLAAARSSTHSDSERGEGTESLVVRVFEAQPSESYGVTRQYTGRITPRRRSAIGFELGGRVAELTADDGDRVDAGAVLARLDTARLEARRAELVADRRQAESRATLARLDVRRLTDAVERGAANATELEDAREELAARRAAVDAALRRIGSIEVDLDKSSLRSPFDAMVARRRVDEGSVVDAGTPIFVLLERAAPEARVSVPPAVAAGVERGSTPDVIAGGRRFGATLANTVPLVDEPTRTVELVLELDARLGDPGTPEAGELVTLAVGREIQRHGFWLPMSALTESVRGMWACAVAEPRAQSDPGNAANADRAEHAGTHTLARRRLEVLHTESDRVYVSGGLTAGELVVAEGLHRVSAGQSVRIRRDAEAHEAGGTDR